MTSPFRARQVYKAVLFCFLLVPLCAASEWRHEESHEAQDKEDISLTPLAMPLMSGPGAIGVVMALAAHIDNAAAYLGMIIGIAGIALSVVLFFWMGGPLVRRLGPSAVGAINKIFGFLILAIAVQLVWDGIADFNS